MTQVGSVVDFGRRRRLPVWMSAVGSDDKLRKSENEEVNGKTGPSQAPETKATKSKKDITVSEKKVVETDTRKRAKRSSKNDITPSSGINLQKRVLKKNAGNEIKPVGKNATLKTENLKVNLHEANGKLHSVSEVANDDKVELTVEDLISIAQEYVSAEDEKERLDIAAREWKSKTPPSSSSVSLKSISEGSYSEAGSRISISKCATVPSLSDQADTDRHVDERPEEIISTSIARTGDAAQDMLDLFLGPLLQKVDTRERKSDVITIDDLSFTSESSKPTRSEAGRNDDVEAPVEKKKSSLKDKVAMFLD